MKKITLLLSFIACVFIVNAQNLLINPSFETWTSGKPDSWTITATGTATQATTTASGLTGSALQFAATSTTSISQIVVPTAPATTFDPNKTYTISLSYLATAGDGTDARIWCGLITSAVGVSPAVYYAVPTNHADSLLYYTNIHGPGGNLQPATGVSGTDFNGYLLDNRASGVWHTYSCDFKFPAGITQFSFMVRGYTASTVIWDNFIFAEKGTMGLNSLQADNLSISLVGKNLTANNATSFEVYNTLGAKVKVSETNTMNVSDLANGIYIVRSGKSTAKIKL
ncbi:MAG: T9SS type A sorting domain-containing protein [Paludibacter sp.]